MFEEDEFEIRLRKIFERAGSPTLGTLIGLHANEPLWQELRKLPQEVQDHPIHGRKMPIPWDFWVLGHEIPPHSLRELAITAIRMEGKMVAQAYEEMGITAADIDEANREFEEKMRDTGKVMEPGSSSSWKPTAP